MKVRLVFIRCLQAACHAPNNPVLWKRICLLSTVLFIDVSSNRRADLIVKLELIMADQWPFKVGDLVPRARGETGAYPAEPWSREGNHNRTLRAHHHRIGQGPR